jgi:hypothetical protein
MSFTNLIFLFGTLAVLGPLLAHLWANPRYRRVPFTMMQFLQIGQEKNQSRQNLKNFLVLLLRCLIIASIAMLFAGPRWLTQAPPIKNTSVYYIALDDSLSMAYRDGTKTYFNTMIERTKRYIASAATEGSFNLYAMASGKTLINASQYEAEIFLNKLRVNPSQASLTEFLNGVINARSGNPCPERVYAFLAGDFTPKMMEMLSQIQLVAPVYEIKYEKIAAKDTINNIAITNAQAMLDANGALQINAHVVNYGQVDQQSRMSVRINGNILCEIKADLSAGGQQNLNCVLPTPKQLNQWLPLELHLENPDGLVEDNSFYLPIMIPEKKKLRVVLAGNDNREMFLIKTALDTLASQGSGDTITVDSRLLSQLKPFDLNSADVLIFSSLDPALRDAVKELQTFVQGGGKIVFFATKNCSTDIMQTLVKADILPVLPQTFHSQVLRLEPSPSTSDPILELSLAAETFLNYRMDRIAFCGFFEYQPASESTCVWRFANQVGFLYFKPYGMGRTMWINTSTDDSMGILMKSPAAIPFCQYLLGGTTRLEENKILIGEPVTFPCSIAIDQNKTMEILTPCGSKRNSISSASSYVLNCSDEIGFFKTSSTPACYAGVNPNEGETNMEKADDKTLQAVLEKVFPILPKKSNIETVANEEKQYKPVWKYFAWIIIVLITAEAFITNRMQR